MYQVLTGVLEDKTYINPKIVEVVNFDVSYDEIMCSYYLTAKCTTAKRGDFVILVTKVDEQTDEKDEFLDGYEQDIENIDSLVLAAKEFLIACSGSVNSAIVIELELNIELLYQGTMMKRLNSEEHEKE